MGIQLSTEQVLTMAPDASSASAGKKLANAKNWRNLGQSSEVLWGECQGSAVYQVRVEPATLAIQCSCPSRKIPCKHGIALLLMAVNTPDIIPTAEHPEWVTSWLTKRAATAKRKETLQETAKTATTTAPSASQRKNAEKRLAQVTQGIAQLDLWLDDLVRNGLGNLEGQTANFWEQQATQMVNAQAPGLATRVRQLGTIPNASPQWPEKLLNRMGQLALLTQAFHTIDQLNPDLQEDLRGIIGWSLKENEVLARGTHVTDEWLFLGQITEERDRGRVQRTWLAGRSSGRSALLWQFAIAQPSFAETYPLGVQLQAELAYWPSAQPQRALLATRQGELQIIQDRLPGVASISAFLADVATTLAHNPWQEYTLCILQAVIPLYSTEQDRWYINDKDAQALPLIKGDHWQLLTLSGGAPLDLAAEWDGENLHPLGVLVEQTYHILQTTRQ